MERGAAATLSFCVLLLFFLLSVTFKHFRGSFGPLCFVSFKVGQFCLLVSVGIVQEDFDSSTTLAPAGALLCYFSYDLG